MSMRATVRASRRSIPALAVASLVVGWGSSKADGAWPEKPITFVVPYTPAGVTDANARRLAKVMGDRLGQRVVVENLPGAGGSLGIETAARRPPDGYTLMYGTQSTHAINPVIYRNVRYDPVKDFVPVHAMSETPMILVLHPSVPVRTVPELVAYARANPGRLTYGSAGAGTGTHLAAELFQMATGVRLLHVPYKGSAPALNDLMSGHVDLMFDYPSIVMPHVDAGKLNALAVTSRRRLTIAPTLPSLDELGLGKASSATWSAVFVPAGTPPAVVKKIGDAIAYAIVDAEVQRASDQGGALTLVGLRDAKLGEFVKSEGARWRRLVERIGARPD